MDAEVLEPVRGFVLVVRRLGIGAGDGERPLEVIGKDELHSLGWRGRTVRDPLVPRDTPFVVELEIAIILDGAVVAADPHRDWSMRIRVRGEVKRAVALRIDGDGGYLGISPKPPASLPAFDGYA